MRILHVTDTFAPRIGGIETMVAQLAERQRASHEVRILTRTGGADAPGLVRDPGRLAELLRWADLVHGHVSVISPLAVRGVSRAARAGVPAVASVHSMWNGAAPALSGLGALGGLGSAPIHWAPVSQRAADAVRRVLGPGVAVTVVPNAVDEAFWRPDDDEAPAGDPARPLQIVAVGRMAMRKRPLRLVEMLAEVRRRLPAQIEIRAVLAGDGPQLTTARRRVHRLGLDSWVELPGALPAQELRALYRRSDLFWAPARLESFGVAALEARTAGLPVLADARTGIGEFVTSGDNGMLVRGDDQMVAAAVGLLARPEVLREFRARNRREPIRHDWRHLLAALDDLYTAATRPQAIPAQDDVREEFVGAA